MDLIDRLREISIRIEKQRQHLQTEEATKTALVMPFISALGYNIFDPTSVVPEFTADVGIKKGEKVDYAILDDDGKPIVLIEAKTAGTDLEKVHASQLYRYFSVTSARFGVLTDGISYRFFSDLDAPNKMDSRPFLEFCMTEVGSDLARELRRFTKEAFDLDAILSTASDLKYTGGIKRILDDEWSSPSEELVRLLTMRVYPGRFTQSVRDQFTTIIKKAMQEFLTERVNERLQFALDRDSQSGNGHSPEVIDEVTANEGIVTTEEEWEGLYAVKAILRDIVDAGRVGMRDRKRYCGVLLDDTNRKPICRLYFNGERKYVGLYDADKCESKHPIDGVDGIFAVSQQIRETVLRYEGVQPDSTEPQPAGEPA